MIDDDAYKINNYNKLLAEKNALETELEETWEILKRQIEINIQLNQKSNLDLTAHIKRDTKTIESWPRWKHEAAIIQDQATTLLGSQRKIPVEKLKALIERFRAIENQMGAFAVSSSYIKLKRELEKLIDEAEEE